MSIRGKDGRYGTYQDYVVGQKVNVYHKPEDSGGTHPKGKSGVIVEITEEGTMVLKDGRAFNCAGNGITSNDGWYLVASDYCSE